MNSITFEDFIKEWRSGQPFIEARTSGSTGIPKEIRLDKEFVRQSACRTNSFFGITSESRLHSCVSPEYIGGKMMAVRSEEACCRLTWERPSNTPLLSVGKEERIDLLAVVPSQMLHIVDRMGDMPEIGSVIIGGSAINPSLRDKIVESGIKAYETYGMTETSSHIALRRVEREEKAFEVLPGIRVELDVRGCLVVVFDSGERVETNDLAVLTAEGGFIITGRHDHVIITGGKKVNPYDVEKRISGLISSPFMISSKPDEKWGNKVVLKIEGEGQDDTEGMMEKMRHILEPWEMPKEIIPVERLERTQNGKLKR